MEDWKLDRTYALIKQVCCVERANKARDSAASIAQKQMFVKYHYSEINRLKLSFDKRYPSKGKLFEMHTDEGRRTIRPAFDRFILKAGAHATAAVQCLHSIPDILAQVAYITLEPTLFVIIKNEKNINLSNVIDNLKKNKKYPKILEQLDFLRKSDDWRHLDAIANNIKHRAIVPTSYNQDLTGRRTIQRELQTLEFKRGENTYPSRSISLLIQAEYQRMSKIAVLFGCELNALLSDMKLEYDRAKAANTSISKERIMSR